MLSHKSRSQRSFIEQGFLRASVFRDPLVTMMKDPLKTLLILKRLLLGDVRKNIVLTEICKISNKAQSIRDIIIPPFTKNKLSFRIKHQFVFAKLK